MFTYVASGIIQVGGCSAYEERVNICYEYAIGSLVFEKIKAMKGIYERHCIKDVRFDMQQVKALKRVANYSAVKPLYIDTFNAYWNEDELVSYEDAKALVEAYIIQRNAELQQMALNCQP